MTHRARARVLTRRRQPQPWLFWLMLLAALSLAVAVLEVARAATADTNGAEKTLPLHKQPPAAGVKKVAPGVLKPKHTPDVGMVMIPPNGKKFPMPVIKPPVSKDSAKVIPK